MSDEPDLFSLVTEKVIGSLKVTKTQQTIADYWMVINGTKLDAVDVYQTLEETCDSFNNSYITNSKMIEALKSIHVLKHGGSNKHAVSPEKGPNYDKFM